MVVTNCGGRTPGSGGTDDGLFLSLMTEAKFIYINKEERPSNIFDTLIVLVEEGGSDPMVSDSNGVNALYCHTGSAEQFEYMLHQDKFQVEVDGDLTAHHAYWCWPTSRAITKLAFDEEMRTKNIIQDSDHLRWDSQFKSSVNELLHRVLLNLRSDMKSGRTIDIGCGHSLPFESQDLVRHFLALGADIHSCLYVWNYGADWSYMTPLAELVLRCGDRLYNWSGKKEDEEKIALESLILSNTEFEDRILASLIQFWIDFLKEINVDIEKYTHEEEDLAVKRKTVGDWNGFYACDRFEWRVE